eukprot:Hpha_TRINITY_DN11116_c0_g2::TRINITY_DN11116_c0_g2_i1::g.28172::m.28172
MPSDAPQQSPGKDIHNDVPLPKDLTDKQLERAGLDVLAKLGRQSYGRSPCDAVYTHPTTNAHVFCGGWSAAHDLELLRALQITRIVNCQDPRDSECGNRFEKSREFAYYNFHINGVQEQIGRHSRFSIGGAGIGEASADQKQKRAYELCKPYFEFIDEAIVKGENVLVHCAAGMHRAGGAVVGYIMWANRRDNVLSTYKGALVEAQGKRGVINPYHQDLLALVEAFLRGGRA